MTTNARRMVAEPAPPGAWEMYRSMVGVGLLCGLLIVTVFQVTRPVIRRNKAEALQRAIFRVLPEARSSLTFRLTAGDRFEPFSGEADGEPLVYAGYDDERRLIGLAVEAQGMGYQDVIRVLYGYSFADDAIVGIQVLESKETPGLGDKIENDPGFLENFVRLDVTLTDDLSAIANPIVAVKNGKKQHPWQVDAITGATISSTAIARILRESTEFWVPRIRRGLDDFESVE
jgi:electron transport complex protein RnfG